MSPRGYRIVRSHPCKCGKPGCLAWGRRAYSEECWDNMPEHIKERIVGRAIAASEIPIAQVLREPRPVEPVKRLPPKRYDEQPW
jgi:hypothetical protein